MREPESGKAFRYRVTGDDRLYIGCRAGDMVRNTNGRKRRKVADIEWWEYARGG